MTFVDEQEKWKLASILEACPVSLTVHRQYWRCKRDWLTEVETDMKGGELHEQVRA
jgi:hypothetical protein